MIKLPGALGLPQLFINLNKKKKLDTQRRDHRGSLVGALSQGPSELNMFRRV